MSSITKVLSTRTTMSKRIYNVWYIDCNGQTQVQPVYAHNEQEAADAVNEPMIIEVTYGRCNN